MLAMNRAHCNLAIKTVGEAAGKRTFVGVATTNSTDTVGDIVEPRGAVFSLPLPLLWSHDVGQPIGWVTSANVKDSVIEVVCEVASVSEPGTLKDRLDEIWSMVKAKLVQGLSIGFSDLESAPISGTSGRRYRRWRWRELSACVLPANTDCEITAARAAVLANQRALSSIAPAHKQGDPMKDFALLKVNSRFELSLQEGTGSKCVSVALTRIQAQRLADELHAFASLGKSLDGGRDLAFAAALAAAPEANTVVRLSGNGGRKASSSKARPGVVHLESPKPTRGVVYLDDPKPARPVVRLKP